MNYEKSLQFAQKKDSEDELKDYRNQFHIPQVDGKDSIYFCGNSLGLQPKITESYIQQELQSWRKLGGCNECSHN